MLKRQKFSFSARAAAIVALAAAVAAKGAAEAEGVPVTCTNPFSGASWQIAIDYDLKTVELQSGPHRRNGDLVARREGWLALYA